jgi:hypothetical protein
VADGSAILEVKSTTKGSYYHVWTKDQRDAIVEPVAAYRFGALIVDLRLCIFYRKWVVYWNWNYSENSCNYR